METRTIRDEGRTYKGLAKICNKVKVTITKLVGQTGGCDKSGVSRGAHPDGTTMENYGANS